MASKTTEAGSACSLTGFTILMPILSAQIDNCSTAPARKVSAAAISTFLFSLLNLFAILAIEVVLPDPLTPVIIKMLSLFSLKLSLLSSFQALV